MKDNKKNIYNSHYNSITGQYQSNYTHSSETADIAAIKNPFPYLENMVWLAGLLHDAGKFSIRWQQYFEKRVTNSENTSGPKEDHTTAGGQLAEELCPSSLLSQFIQTIIYSHHGLQNCIEPEDGVSLYVKRKAKAGDLPVRECREQFYREFDQKEVGRRSKLAEKEALGLRERISKTVKSWEQPGLYGNRDFFLGMYERLMMSLLIDADRRNTEDFMSGGDKAPNFTDEELSQIWNICGENVEKKIAGLAGNCSNTSRINTYRAEISNACNERAFQRQRLYWLTVPTGAGKTLSSLRFAVAHGKIFHKKRIIYVAPFMSITEQNAKEIREALGMPEIVLEHHCNIVMDSDEEKEYFDRVTEDWSLPVIVTTAVQFLNTLFAGKTGNVRRMHSLCDSVIIMDEVQALPVNLLELFNLAVNFLTEFADTTMVLCTATRPLLNDFSKNRLRPAVNMTGQTKLYREKLRRTEIIDCTSIKPGGLSIGEAAEFVFNKAEEYGKVLFIVNTKTCARRVFQRLVGLCGDAADLSHLSTNMCPEHRSHTLKAVRKGLSDRGGEQRMQICVSTQLIEAGVDISFRCVIRSLAGLDSIIQSAGRCNRNKEADLGYVFLVKMEAEAERLSRLKDIRYAQEAMESVLSQFHRGPENLDGRLDSEKAVIMYFQYYFSSYLKQDKDPMSFPVKVKGVPTTIVNLLSDNFDFAKKGTNRQMLKQAFKAAGEEFEVIADTSKISVIVPYGETVKEKLQELENPHVSLGRKKQCLRELQPYTVSISQTEHDQLGQAIYGIWNHQVLVLEERYYDSQLGIITEPNPMPDLQI